jgi:hypothetical protein
MRSSLAIRARRRASLVLRRGRFPGLAAAATKPFRQFLEGLDELGVVDLDFSETGLEREPTDAFGLARFGDFELLLQSGYVFLDLR